MSGRLPVMLSSFEAVILLGHLPVRLSSCDVVYLKGCLPFQNNPTMVWYVYLAQMSSFGTFPWGVGLISAEAEA